MKLTNKDLVNYAYTIRDKVSENKLVMMQIANNTPEQAMLGDFSKAVDDAVMDSSAAHQNQMIQLLADPEKAYGLLGDYWETINDQDLSKADHHKASRKKIEQLESHPDIDKFYQEFSSCLYVKNYISKLLKN